MHRDVLETITGHLGLDAVNLRQTSKTFAQVTLPSGVSLALKALQVGPSIPTALHVLRRTTRACTLVKWDYFSYRATLQWRMEWARLMTFLKRAPINTLIDAFEAIPSGKKNFFGTIFLGNVPDMELSTSPDASEPIKPRVDDSRSSAIEGSDYTSHVLLALHKAIEERLWDLCQSTDLGQPMDPDEVVPTVHRILTTTRLRNNQCFFFTDQGWLKYTLFLLAAESHNYELVWYLAKRTDTNTAACSAGGNNARALCTHALSRLGWTDQEMAKSPVLKLLTEKCKLPARPYVEEGRG